MSVTVGQPAPTFSMPTDSGSVSLAGLKGKRIVLYFYPKDDTSGCTSEAQGFKEDIHLFRDLNTVIIGVSKDSIASHIKFKTKYDLPFDLASDEDGSTCVAYDVWKEKSNYGRKYMGIERSTFLIDENGIVLAVWNKVKVTGHTKAVLKTIQEL
jgi:peroxiredoxin Q/BCP